MNPITASKNIPTDATTLADYAQVSEATKKYSKHIHVFIRLSSSQSPSFIKQRTFLYLRQNSIYLVKSVLPSCNVIISSWILKSHTEYINAIDLKEKMVKQLNGFSEFNLRARRYFCPHPKLPLRTRVWLVEMDKSVYQEHFDLFSKTFHYDNDITIVPNHHHEKWDPNDIDLKQMISEHNEYLRNTTVVPIYNLKNIYEKVTIQGKETTLEAALHTKCTEGDRPLITEMSQYNRDAVHLITKISDKETVENLVEELIADDLTKLKPEEK